MDDGDDRVTAKPPAAQSSQEATRAIHRRGGRRRWIVPIVIGAVVVLAIAVAVVWAVTTGRHQDATTTDSTQADTSAAVLASTSGQARGETVDGIASSSTEQVLFHIHAHLAIYVNGQQRLVPYGIGIVPPYQLQSTPDGPFVTGGSKFYWLHTHDESGVIHIESPVQRMFTLGDLFDLWHQPLGPSRVGPADGNVTAFVNAHEVNGDPRGIPLGAHDVIQLDVGSVQPFQPYTFPNGR
jgi:hypothetical protein